MPNMPDIPAYLARLAHPAGEKNAFSKLFDEISSVDEVRSWIKKDPQQLWGSAREAEASLIIDSIGKSRV